GDVQRATHIAAGAGKLVAWGLIVLGVSQLFGGDLGGLWIAFIGWFLLNAAAQSEAQLRVERLLSGHTAGELMAVNAPAVPRRMTLDAFVDGVVLPSRQRCFPVEEDGQVYGLVTVHRLRSVP